MSQILKDDDYVIKRDLKNRNLSSYLSNKPLYIISRVNKATVLDLFQKLSRTIKLQSYIWFIYMGNAKFQDQDLERYCRCENLFTILNSSSLILP